MCPILVHLKLTELQVFVASGFSSELFSSDLSAGIYLIHICAHTWGSRIAILQAGALFLLRCTFQTLLVGADIRSAI